MPNLSSKVSVGFHVTCQFIERDKTYIIGAFPNSFYDKKAPIDIELADKLGI